MMKHKVEDKLSDIWQYEKFMNTMCSRATLPL